MSTVTQVPLDDLPPVNTLPPIDDPNRDLESASPPLTDSLTKPRRRRAAFIPGFRDRPPPKRWLRYNWFDITTQLLCLLTAWMLFTFVPPIMPRYFPLYAGIERSSWGRKYGQPYMTQYIGTILSAVMSYAVPAAVMGGIALWGTREFADGNAALVGLGYALATATLFQSFIKIFVGGLRPNFLSICAPAIPPTISGLDTTGPSQHLYYTASQVCTGNSTKVNEAQMSFPSGHSCAAFAGFGFLALYLNAKFKIFGQGRRSGFPNTSAATSLPSLSVVGENKSDGVRPRRIQHWKLFLFVAPWCIAILIGGSKVRDGWHHPIDVVFGALVGTAFAHMAFRMVYRSVYDWRDNHVPMERSK